MQIKTITCHDVYNHGASLQAYALMKYLKNKGHSVEIIDYQPEYLSSRLNLWFIGEKWKNKNIIVRLLYLVLKFPRRFMRIKAIMLFNLFKKEYMQITRQCYVNNNELKKDPPYAEAYISGSDQIWNTLYNNGRDPAFYLDFSPEGSRRIAYAASFSASEVVPEYKDFVKSMIDKYDFISVREISGVDILKSLGIDRGVHVLDPVFLLDRDEWECMAREKFRERYILSYEVGPNTLIESIATRMREEKGLKIYAVNNYAKTPYADRDYYNCGPKTFLSLIKGAELILSNSFHATAFSIIFRKPFYVFYKIDEDVNSRMLDLLAICKLENRMIQAETNLNPDILPLDYEQVDKRISEYVFKSKQYIEHALHSALDGNGSSRA